MTPIIPPFCFASISRSIVEARSGYRNREANSRKEFSEDGRGNFRNSNENALNPAG